MKKIFVFSLLICFSLALMVSCKSRKPAEPVIITNTKTITQKVHDTLLKVEADSTYYNALIECQNGKPQIVQNSVSKKDGRSLKTTTSLVDGKLNVKTKADPQEIKKSWMETNTQEIKPQVVFVPRNVEVEKPLTFWQKLQIWAGRIFLLELALCVAYFFLRTKI
jgi:hypothetical protein